MLDRSKIGHIFPPFQVELDKGRLRLFAKAIGETSPIYIDEVAAKSAGYRSLLMPPTYPFCLGKDIPDPSDVLNLLGLNYSEILHGEQEYTYHDSVCAGDTLFCQKRITDIYDKKNGALEFIVVHTDFRNTNAELVCEALQTIIVKRGLPA